MRRRRSNVSGRARTRRPGSGGRPGGSESVNLSGLISCWYQPACEGLRPSSGPGSQASSAVGVFVSCCEINWCLNENRVEDRDWETNWNQEICYTLKPLRLVTAAGRY
ncbi:hypothetical protein EVAR_640_1 [Eumeta japonica]|uniref:Uncharacterized protein n=1 Tax=Eumeta variegata TaxID=151549 RepID=A0A4C1SEA1_EUMVA|nr:hypothetical protein EVAR_640_1 [Eumeta japonica]